MADSLLPVAELLLQQGSPTAAIPLAEEGLSILRGALPAEHFRVVKAQAILEECLQPQELSEASE